MTWSHGRQLTSLLADDGELNDITYSYDVDGIRNQKTEMLQTGYTLTHDYTTQNGKVVRETISGNNTSTKVLDFVYDESGRPFAVIYTNGTATPDTYYYVLNLQGDVVGLVNSSGGWVAQYTYNAWGEIITSSGTMADINPLRYRGYYYDTETGFYYLQSRYYDPVTHRFINANSYASTGQGIIGTNMFAYCNNCPIMNVDSTGKIPFFSGQIGADALLFGAGGFCGCSRILVPIGNGENKSGNSKTGWNINSEKKKVIQTLVGQRIGIGSI